MRELPENHEGRQIVVAPNWIGDTAMAAPFFASLRTAYPGDRIEALATPWSAGILDTFPWLDAVLRMEGGKWRRFFSVRSKTRGDGIKSLWFLPNSFRSALLGRWLGAARRIGYATGGRGWLLTHPVPPPPDKPPPHLVDYYLGLLEAEGVTPVHRSVRLPVSPEAAEFADHLLREETGSGDIPLIGLNPGAFFGASKTWPVESYAALARRLAAGARARVVVLGGPKEVDLANSVCAAAGGAAVNLAGKDSLKTLPALLARLSVLVSGDTGPLHIAALVGVRTVSLFGPTDPQRTAPRGEAHRHLRRDLECSPCFERVCPLGHHRCMKEISPEEVAEEVEGILAIAHPSRPAGAGASK